MSEHQLQSISIRSGQPWYGWIIVVVAALAMVATLPGRTHGLGMITERLLADPHFQLDRVSYSNINFWATLIGGLFCLPCGWLIDRFGLRVSLTATVVALTATVFWMTRIDNQNSFAFAILLTRGFGQSALSVISITMVGKWFRGHLSMPMAIYTLLLSLGFAYAAQWAKPFADDDWRVLWSNLGYMLAAFIPIALFLTFDPPRFLASESGVISGKSDQVQIKLNHESDGFTLFQAMATPAFWVFGISISLIALIGAGTSLFSESLVTEQGFDKKTFYDLMTLTGTVGMFAKLPIGWLGQRMKLNQLLTWGMLLLAICIGLFPFIHTLAGIQIYAVVMGISGTITTVLFFTIWGQAYGKAHLGVIQSVAQMMTVLASAAGPRLFAECHAQFGNYARVFYLLSAVSAAIGVWSWFVRVPRPEDAPLSVTTDIPMLVAEPSLPQV